MTLRGLGDQCGRCVHHRRIAFVADGARTRADILCDAFPESPGIPQVIVAVEFDHRVEYPGDHGVRWEGIDGAPHPTDGLANEAYVASVQAENDEAVAAAQPAATGREDKFSQPAEWIIITPPPPETGL